MLYTADTLRAVLVHISDALVGMLLNKWQQLGKQFNEHIRGRENITKHLLQVSSPISASVLSRTSSSNFYNVVNCFCNIGFLS